MEKTRELYAYRLFGLNIRSKIQLKEAIELNSLGESSVQVTVKYDDLTNEWFKLAAHNEKYISKDSFFMFIVPDTAIFLIQNGREIIVSPLGMNEDKIRLYILGTCIGMILLQRRILPLHGSAVVLNNKAYAFVGESGAGKSTLAKAFLNKGYKLLSDDIAAVSFDNNQVPFVFPSYPQQKLWENSLKEFGINSNHFTPIFQRETKFSVPVLSQFATCPVPLAGVFELVSLDSVKTPLVKEVNGIKKIHTLSQHTFRKTLISSPSFLKWHFNTIAHLGDQIKVYQLQRPVTGFYADELMDLVIHYLAM